MDKIYINKLTGQVVPEGYPNSECYTKHEPAWIDANERLPKDGSLIVAIEARKGYYRGVAVMHETQWPTVRLYNTGGNERVELSVEEYKIVYCLRWWLPVTNWMNLPDEDFRLSDRVVYMMLDQKGGAE